MFRAHLADWLGLDGSNSAALRVPELAEPHNRNEQIDHFCTRGTYVALSPPISSAPFTPAPSEPESRPSH